MIGLVDCNNFFVSCERVFRPDLENKPVIVLSNNDGCAVARSQEAKELGIKMGDPYFKLEHLTTKKGLVAFSSNYVLYGDMSLRVISTIRQFVPNIEIYSIDESFLYFEGFESYNLAEYGRIITRTVKRNTGIPVSLGIAPTKTLAKAASKYAKKYPSYQSVCMIDTDEKRVKALKLLPVGDIWGIGHQYEKFLLYHGVKTAYDFILKPEAWIRRNLKVTGVRTWKELQGIPCIPKEDIRTKKNICTSRSFGTMVNDYGTLAEAISNFAASCALKLRSEKTAAGEVTVFILTNPFREDLAQYYQKHTITLPVATNLTSELISAALNSVKEIYMEGYMFKKAGVIVSCIVPEGEIQGNLFDNINRKNFQILDREMDNINRKEGRDTLKIAAQGFSKKWKLRNQFISKRYTTRWDELMEIE